MRQKINEWGATEPVLCIATELLAGGSIGSIVSNYGPLEEGVVQTYTRDILHGLSYLHEKKLVHRDIKPANILISVDGRAKIGDFGESKMLGASLTAKDENLTMKGTPFFMAPEVLLEDGHGRKADIWSVGATVLQMATGFPPWRENGFKQIVQLLLFLGQNLTVVPNVPTTCSNNLTSFLLLCLQRQPALRLSGKRNFKFLFFFCWRHTVRVSISSKSNILYITLKSYEIFFPLFFSSFFYYKHTIASDLLNHEFMIDDVVATEVAVRRQSFGEGRESHQTIRRIITQGEKIFSS